MNAKVHFSYSTLNFLHTHSHCWINKMMGIKVPENESMRLGKLNQRIIQEHVSGFKKDPRISYLTAEFSVVEKRDFDEDTKFTLNLFGYEIIGFFDGKSPEDKRSLEIKLSSSPWSMGKFKDSIQRKIYTLAEPNYTESTLITGSLHPEEWEQNKLKFFVIKNTEKDKEDALKWIKEGILIFENGDFNGGLDEEGRCTDPWCPWGNACHFKQI